MKYATTRNEFLYFVFDDFNHVMRFRVRLTVDVNGEILNEAVQESVTRFPYFCIRVIRQGEDYVIEHNDAPVPVHKGIYGIALGTEEAGGHFMAVGYEDNCVSFDMYHNLTDAKGLCEWVKTVIYLYLNKALDITLPSDGIRIPGQDFLPGETDDPYENMDLEAAASPFVPTKDVDTFLPDLKYATSPEKHNYVIRASVSEMMAFARSQDGSPAAVISYFMKEVMRKLYPDWEGKSMVCGIPHSFRDLATGENNYHNQTTEVYVVFDERYEKMDVEKQLTCIRGTIILLSDPANILHRLYGRAAFAASLDEMPTVAERLAANRGVLQEMIDEPETIAVSYVGQIDWGAIEPYMIDIALESEAISSPCLVGVVPVNDWFIITLKQKQTSEVYADTLVGLLNDSGITAERVYDFGENMCTLHMP